MIHNAKKKSQSIALSRKAKQFVSQDTLLNMFNAVVLRHLAYCWSVWNDGSCAHMSDYPICVMKAGF